MAVTNISDDSRLMQEEIFGPVVCVQPFETEDEVIARANNVIYGLSASLWSNDVSQVHRVAQKLQVCLKRNFVHPSLSEICSVNY